MNPYESLATPILAAFPELEPADLVFAPAPKLDLGDVSLRTFAVAKKLKCIMVCASATTRDRT